MTEKQTRLYQLLCAFADLCEYKGLRYYLAGGTLLGAVRHHGFIPWDDDIDVMMPAEDHKIFLQHTAELPAWIGEISEQMDENYPYYITKFYDTNDPMDIRRGSEMFWCHMDVFPLMRSRAPDKVSEFYFNIICVIDYVLQVRCGWTKYTPYKNGSAKIGYDILHSFSKQHLRALRRKLIYLLVDHDSEYLFSPGGEHKGIVEFYPDSWFDQTVFLSFEGRRFPAPAGWDGYLRQLYGDYMTPPPETEQGTKHKG